MGYGLVFLGPFCKGRAVRFLGTGYCASGAGHAVFGGTCVGYRVRYDGYGRVWVRCVGYGVLIRGACVGYGVRCVGFNRSIFRFQGV